MANKFLGLDSINVLKQYIDERIIELNKRSRLMTIQAYTYCETGTIPETPADGIGGFDINGLTIVYPNGWYSLKTLLSRFDSLEDALANGSIWMSAGVYEGSDNKLGPDIKIEYVTPGEDDSETIVKLTDKITWSLPVKINGQNGVSTRMKYTYSDEILTDDEIKELSDYPQGVSAVNRVEYIWSQSGEDAWQGPKVWATYAENADNVLWRYKVTQELETPSKPAAGDSTWSKNLINHDLSKEYPYMWMSFQIVPAGQKETNEGWSEPILFGHWGMDGDVPDYTKTLYRKGGSNPEISDVEGIIQPNKPEFVEDATIDNYLIDGWKELPTDRNEDLELEGDDITEDHSIWWQCTFKVNGKTNKVVDAESIGAVKRYNAIDGNSKPGQFTMNLYAWSENQLQPEMADIPEGDWKPSNYDYLPDRPLELTAPEASLWMITANVQGLDENGTPIVNGSWSEPVKLTGPRGPIAYDYRIETRYNIGTSDKPRATPKDEEWFKTAPNITSQYPYIWANNHLVCYKMKYGTTLDPSTGEYDVIPADDGKVIKTYDYYRLSGINGEDGNRKNSIVYSDDTETNAISVTSFSSTNLYISNSTKLQTYNIALDQLSFINGYTGKFANIGNENIKLTLDSKFKFAGSGKTASELIISPQESVELVCYNKINNDKTTEMLLLVIGKELS